MSIRLASILAMVISGWVLPASADTRSVHYTTVAGWTVKAVYKKPTNRFSFCTAATQYRDLTYFFITVNFKGEWSLSLFNKNWPADKKGTVPVTLVIDSVVVDRTAATWIKNGAFINFGTATDKVVALMRGRALAVRTPQGTSRFALDGSYKAALAALECWRLHADGQGGAFGPSPPQTAGAFGGTSPSAVSSEEAGKPQVLSRAKTLEVAVTYLGETGVPYKILPEQDNLFDNLPVNWTYGEGSIGGMLLLSGTGLSGEQLLISLLQDQAGFCTGKSGTNRLPVRTTNDATHYSATGACENQNGAFSVKYKIAEGSNFAIVVTEFLAMSDAETNPTLDHQTDFSGGIFSKFNPR